MKSLQKYMDRKGINQSELARMMEVAQPTVWAWVHGTKRPTPDKLCKLADITGLTVDQLLDRKSVA